MLLIVVALLGLVPPLISRWMVDTLLNPKKVTIPDNLAFIKLYQAAAAMAVVYMLTALFNRGRSVIMHILGEKFVYDLRIRMYSHLQKLSLTFFETRQTGEMMSRVSNDSDVLEQFVTHAADTVIADALTVLTIVGILFYFNVPLAAVTLAPLPVLALVTLKYSRQVRKMHRSTRERLAEMNAKLQENLSGIRVIKSFAQEENEYFRFEGEARNLYGMRISVVRMFTMFQQSTQMIMWLGMVAIWVYGGCAVMNSTISFGTFLVFTWYYGMFAQPVRNLAQVNDTIQRALAAADRILELLDTEPDLVDAEDAIDLPPIEGRVEFHNVHFGYATSEEVLSGINIEAQPGQIIALVGRSGAGKTSIVNLIPRFYDPHSGRVTVDGCDVKHVTQRSLRSQIGIVLQDTFLFNGTVRENILYGRPDASEEEMIEASRTAHAHSFIMSMPQGYDTEIGERGVKLSGGQRQRLAIARAVLANPRILILDEATSSVDSESEYLIHRAMDELMKGRTTFVIAHRLSTIKHADLIVALEEGKIVEVGDHNTLIAQDGAYSQMYEMQYRLDTELA